MINPLWQREINIAKIRIEMMLMNLQMEYQNGAKVYGSKKGQPANPSQEVRGAAVGPIAEEQNQNPNGGANPANPATGQLPAVGIAQQ
jgi:hypothetical protein